MSSQMFWGTDRNRVKFDWKFTESINQYMQVPSRLKIVEDSAAGGDGVIKDDHPPSFQMHIPDRISLADVEMIEVGLSPFQLEQRRWRPPVFTTISHGHSYHALRSSELPSTKPTAKSGSSNPNRLNTSQKVQTTDVSPAAGGAINQRTGKEMCCCPGPDLTFPPCTEDGRIYSLSNVCRMLRFLGGLLYSRLQNSLHFPSRPSLPAMEDDSACRTSALEMLPPLSTPPQLSALDLDHNTPNKLAEDPGIMEVIAMRKLLIKISGRLQSLEEERAGCYQKELLIYSALLTACLINTLLWLTR